MRLTKNQSFHYINNYIPRDLLKTFNNNKTQPTTLIFIEIANQNSCQTATTLEEFMYFELDMNYKQHTKIAKIAVATQQSNSRIEKKEASEHF